MKIPAAWRAVGNGAASTAAPSGLSTWWAQRPLREKLLITLGAVGMLLWAADTLIAQPVEKRLRRAKAEGATEQTELKQMRASAAIPEPAGNAELRAREAELRKRLVVAQRQGGELRQRAAEATRLPEALRAITATVGSVRVLSLDLASDSVTPSTAVQAPNPAPARDDMAAAPLTSGAAAQRRLYRLPINLKISGNWDELQTVLSSIERHADSLQWSAVVLDSTEWPAIQLTLKAHVLSLDSRWGATP